MTLDSRMTIYDRIRALPPERIKVLARPIGIACMECVLSLELPPEVQRVCGDVDKLLRDPAATPEKFLGVANAAAAYAAHAAHTAHAARAAHTAHAAAYAARAAAYAAAYTSHAAAYAARAAAYTSRAAAADAAAEHAAEVLITKLALLVG